MIVLIIRSVIIAEVEASDAFQVRPGFDRILLASLEATAISALIVRVAASFIFAEPAIDEAIIFGK